MKSNPDFLDSFNFILAVECGDLTEAQFEASAQAFVDSNIWRQLQGSWGRTVYEWVGRGLVSI